MGRQLGLIFGCLFVLSAGIKRSDPYLGSWVGIDIKNRPAASLSVEFVSGVISDRLHKAILSDGIFYNPAGGFLKR